MLPEPAPSRPAQAPWGRLLLACWLISFAACLCPPSQEALLAVGYRTPRQTLETFQTFLRGDLPEREYLCFSSGFRRANGLSATGYAEGREMLFQRQPWLKLLARAEVVAERAESEEIHWIDVRMLGRTVRVKLVREGFFEILAGQDLLADGYAEPSELIEVAEGARGGLLVATVPLSDSASTVSGLSELVIASHWKIDGLVELDEADEPAP